MAALRLAALPVHKDDTAYSQGVAAWMLVPSGSLDLLDLLNVCAPGLVDISLRNIKKHLDGLWKKLLPWGMTGIGLPATVVEKERGSLYLREGPTQMK